MNASFDAARDGVACALLAAHDDVRPGARLSIDVGDLLGAAVNRSEVAYAHNPEEERARYRRCGGEDGKDGVGGEGVNEGAGNVDTSMTVLSITAAANSDGGDGGGERVRVSGGASIATAASSSSLSPLSSSSVVRGAIAWYAVHGTSLCSSNRLVSGDNKGVASWLAETALRGDQASRYNTAAAGAATAHSDSAPGTIGGEGEGVRAVIDAFGGGGAGGGGGAVPAVPNVLRDLQAAANAVGAAAAAAAVAGPSRAGRRGRGHGAVVAFPQSASGDVSPNVRGAWCKNCGSGGDGEREACDPVTGACNGSVTACAGRGPAGEDDAAGCVAVGAAQAASALCLMPIVDVRTDTKVTSQEQNTHPHATTPASSAVYLSGPVSSAHAWLPIGRGVGVGGAFARDGQAGVTTSPALGYSFAAGTTDGPGADGFLQGDTCDAPTGHPSCDMRLVEGEDENAGKRTADGVDAGVDAPAGGAGGERRKRRILGAVASWALSGFATWGVPKEVREAHAPKPVLLHFGDSVIVGGEGGGGGNGEGGGEESDGGVGGSGGSYERSSGVRDEGGRRASRELGSPWVAVDVPVQMFRIGRLLVAAVPAEVTTMAGRRLRESILAAAAAAAAAATARAARTPGSASASAPTPTHAPASADSWTVVITCLANGYAGYVTTPVGPSPRPQSHYLHPALKRPGATGRGHELPYHHTTPKP